MRAAQTNLEGTLYYRKVLSVFIILLGEETGTICTTKEE
jgi:hypothetical protein